MKTKSALLFSAFAAAALCSPYASARDAVFNAGTTWANTAGWSDGIVGSWGDDISVTGNLQFNFKDIGNSLYDAISKTAYMNINSFEMISGNHTGPGNNTYNVVTIVEGLTTKSVASGSTTIRSNNGTYRMSFWLKGGYEIDFTANNQSTTTSFGGAHNVSNTQGGFQTFIISKIDLKSDNYNIGNTAVSFNRISNLLVNNLVTFGKSQGGTKTVALNLNDSTLRGSGDAFNQVAYIGGLKTEAGAESSAYVRIGASVNNGVPINYDMQTAELVLIGTRNEQGVADKNSYGGSVSQSISVTMDGRSMEGQQDASTYQLSIKNNGSADAYQALRGENTYWGTTTIKNGTLMLRADTTYQKPVEGESITYVETTGVGDILLQGGQFGAIGATDEIGTIVAADMTWTGGALLFDLAEGELSDFIKVDSLTLSGASQFEFIFAGGVDGEIYQLMEIVEGFSDVSKLYSSTKGVFEMDGNFIVFKYGAEIPEPAEFAIMFGLAALAIATYRRRKN